MTVVCLLFTARTTRYGTGPLRRYIDILAQRQIAAILRGSGYLNKKDLMETVSALRQRQRHTDYFVVYAKPDTTEEGRAVKPRAAVAFRSGGGGVAVGVKGLRHM